MNPSLVRRRPLSVISDLRTPAPPSKYAVLTIVLLLHIGIIRFGVTWNSLKYRIRYDVSRRGRRVRELPNVRASSSYDMDMASRR